MLIINWLVGFICYLLIFLFTHLFYSIGFAFTVLKPAGADRPSASGFFDSKIPLQVLLPPDQSKMALILFRNSI